MYPQCAAGIAVPLMIEELEAAVPVGVVFSAGLFSITVSFMRKMTMVRGNKK